MILRKIDNDFFVGKNRVDVSGYYQMEELAEILAVHPLKFAGFKKLINALSHLAVYTGSEAVLNNIRQTGKGHVAGFEVAPLDFTEKNCFLPYYDKSKLLFLMNKKALLPFLERYKDELIAHGIFENRIKAILANIPILEETIPDLMDMWSFAKKLGGNSYVAKELACYIEDRFLGSTYRTENNGVQTQSPMFVYVKKNRGGGSFYFKREAFNTFKERYASQIQSFLLQAEKNNEFEDLRSFVRKISKSGARDKDVYDFIIKNCLNDTFEVTDKEGTKNNVPIFEETTCAPKGCFKARKSGLIPFVLKWEEELNKLGLDTKFLLTGLRSFRQQKDLVLPKKLASLFASGKITDDFIIRLIEQKKVFDIKVVRKDNHAEVVPLVDVYYKRGKKCIGILKEHIPFFVQYFQDDFLSIGVHKSKIDRLIYGQEIPNKTAEMISFRDLRPFVKMDPAKLLHLTSAIKKEHLNATYTVVDAKGHTHEEPVFVYAYSASQYAYFFKNEAAVKGYMIKYGDFLIEHGVNPFLIESVRAGREIVPFDEKRHVPREELNKKILHMGHRYIKDEVYASSRFDTYPARDEKGNPVLKNMFELTEDKTGRLSYSLVREGIKFFARKHQKSQNIHPLEVANLWGEVELRDKKETDITISLFGEMLCMKRNIHLLREKIENDWINDTYAVKDEQGNVIQNKRVFVFVRPSDAPACLQVDGLGVEDFFLRREAELKELGVPTEYLKKAQQCSGLDMKAFMKKRCIKKYEIRTNAWLKASEKRGAR